MYAPKTIDAGEVVLHTWRPEWAEAAAAAVQASLAELAPFLLWATAEYDVTTARTYIAEVAEQRNRAEAFGYAVFTVAGELVGAAGLMTRMGPGTLEIGYWIHSGHTGRGYATMAATALARVGLSMSGIERVVIRHDAANVASGRVAAKAGFVEVDRVERKRDSPGATGTDVVWELRG